METRNEKSLPPPSKASEKAEIVENESHELPMFVAPHDPKPTFEYLDPYKGTTPAEFKNNKKYALDFHIPAGTPINLYRSRLEGKLEVGAQGAGLYTWLLNNWADVESIQFFDANKTKDFRPVEITEVGRWMRICQSYLISDEEYSKREPHDALRQNKDLDLNPFPHSVMNSDYLAPGDKKEPVWLERSDVNDPLTRRFIYRLGDLKETLFAQDKFLIFPGVMVLRFNLRMSDFVFGGTSPLAPRIGAQDPIAGTTYQYSDLRLRMCLESNPANLLKLDDQLQSGYVMPIANLVNNGGHLPATATTHNNLEFKVDDSAGTYIRKVYWAPFSVDSSEVPYAHDLNQLSGHDQLADVTSNIEDYQTWLDKERFHKDRLYCRLKDDSNTTKENNSFEANQYLTKFSPFVNTPKLHQALFVHCDDWTDGRKELALQGAHLDHARVLKFKAHDMKTITAKNTGVALTQRRYYFVFAGTTQMMIVGDPQPVDTSTTKVV